MKVTRDTSTNTQIGNKKLFMKSQSPHYRSYDISLKPTHGLVMGSKHTCSDFTCHWHARFSI